MSSKGASPYYSPGYHAVFSLKSAWLVSKKNLITIDFYITADNRLHISIVYNSGQQAMQNEASFLL